MGTLADEGYTWWGDPCDDDPPYVESVNGKRIVVIPKHWFFNDLRGWNGGGLGGAEAFQAFKYGFDFVYEEAKRGRPGRIDALVHAELGGRLLVLSAGAASGDRHADNYRLRLSDEVHAGGATLRLGFDDANP
jgi:hypothetical protein